MVIGLDAPKATSRLRSGSQCPHAPTGSDGDCDANVTWESAFQDSIEAHLLSNDWLEGDPSGYDRGLGPDPSELVAFLEASQPDEWEQLTRRLGGAASAKERVAKYVADQLTQRGTVDLLRSVTKMNGSRSGWHSSLRRTGSPASCGSATVRTRVSSGGCITASRT